MRLDERWLWLGDPLSCAEAEITIFLAYPGAWWLAVGDELIGPFADCNILRAARVACTPTIDGCELGPSKLAVADLEPRTPRARQPGWIAVREDELPPSTTVYDRTALEPVSGCCTTDESRPRIEWAAVEDWPADVGAAPPHTGRLLAPWNAHPAGSLMFAEAPELEAGFTIIDRAT